MESVLKSLKVNVYNGLDNHQEHFQTLYTLYEELQLFSVEAAFPTEDFTTFIERTAYFGVITKNYPANNEQKEEEEELSRPPVFVETPSQIWDAGFDRGQYNTAPHPPLDQAPPPIGFIYLICSQSPPYPNGSIGELTIGLIIAKEHRVRGYAREAVKLVLEHAFKTFGTHRIQAIILDTSLKDRAITLFTQMHFGHEGTRRRSFYSLMEDQWKDTACLALLDTDWALRSSLKSGPQTIWDEMLNRHFREREELLRWENSLYCTGIKRTSSMETIRVPTVSTAITDSENESLASDGGPLGSDSESASVIHNSVDKGKRKRRMMSDSEEHGTFDDGRRAFPPTAGYDSDIDDSLHAMKHRKTLIERVDAAADESESEDDNTGDRFDPYEYPVPPSRSPTPSSRSSSSPSPYPDSDIEDGYSSAQWEILEASSSASASSFDELSDGEL